ncbi:MULTISPECIES: LysR family transcriptional regulator [unclassified Microbacterium]|uniref:LysR family transcriptional regulator n=1 Tax=unclassified Microbacterium TaxID=2609290 RepID=UPI000EA8F0B7|nr:MULTISPECIES: LysR family transcriptional regulator [unclassified Microbacterium]MBT2486520.1 LysR family transcriptional regulator [Microbacterium sp. ISL-108]RKN69213.1 LysR family transcriptional regulator [Microbacterium sp. CGR2]
MLGRSLDYNLLPPLQALLEERSVTKAAERMRVSQPTMSTTLARLRAHFDDALLVRRGASHELTPLAIRLLAMLPAALGEAERIFQVQAEFEATSSSRSFVIAAVDHAVSRIGPPLTRILRVEAPHVQIEFTTADSSLVNAAPESLRMIDGLILPHGYLSDQPHIDLMSDEWVCVIDADSSLGDAPSVEELLARPWVHTLASKNGMTPARRQLQIKGMDVSVAAVTPYFQTVPSLVRGTDRVALLPETLARRAAAGFGEVRVVANPFALDPVRDAFWWHPERTHDTAHIWLRDVLRRVADSIIGNPDESYS